MKKVIYTCITGGYDELIEPIYITEDFDYICFTDDMAMKSNVWKFRPMPKETEGLSQVKKQRYVKVNPHKVLSEYDLSIWVDGNIIIKSDLNEVLDKYFINSKSSVYVPMHPSRNCLFQEYYAILAFGKDTEENMLPQINRYKAEGFPENYGLLQSRILFRFHNNEDCIRLMETWFNEIKNGSHRDQLSFNYAAWKNKDVRVEYIDQYIYKSQYFGCVFTHKKG